MNGSGEKVMVNYFLNNGMTRSSKDKPINITMEVQPIILVTGLFTYLPMIFLSFTSTIIQINITGKSRALITCDHNEMPINGALGNKIIITESANMIVYKI